MIHRVQMTGKRFERATRPSNDECEAVKKWVESTGYPFESRVADACQDHEFSVMQSSFYSDPITGKSREADVIAWMEESLDALIELSVSFVIECKELDHHATWVLLNQPTPAGFVVNRYWSLYCSDHGRQVALGLPQVEHRPELPLLDSGSEIGYSLIEGPTIPKKDLKGRRASPGESLLQVASAAQARAAMADKLHGDPEEFGDIVIPVLVVKGKLYSASVSNGSVSTVRRVSRGKLLLRPTPREYSYRVVQIVTDEGLDQFLNDAARTAKGLLMCGDRALQEYELEERQRAPSRTVRRGKRSGKP